MKFVCGPESRSFSKDPDTQNVLLYGLSNSSGFASAGAAVYSDLARAQLTISPDAWDFLSIALSVTVADISQLRSDSADGWTREFELEVAVSDPDRWNSVAGTLERALAFLTTDRWRITFQAGGRSAPTIAQPVWHDNETVVLLSGGLDSLIGAIDLATQGPAPVAVSQTVRGDAERQERFAASLGGLRHLQLNHNALSPYSAELSSRARSLGFLAFGAAAASSLSRYRDRERVTLNVCENGFIAINPPLTPGRIGSLSTRTAHPYYLRQIQSIFDAVGIRIDIRNPYQYTTKGEMLANCSDQELLQRLATDSTSCGRFQRFSYTHCGRCVPCQIRRAAFLRWGAVDHTQYVYSDLGRPDGDHSGFDDVRSAAMGIREARAVGLDEWIGTSLSSVLLGDVAPLKDVVARGLAELANLHDTLGVK